MQATRIAGHPLFFALIFIVCQEGGGVASSAPAICIPVKAGLDTTYQTSVRGTALGQALGQSFYAPDTLISGVAVWRPGGDIDALGTRLFITAVDTTQTPPRPNNRQILYASPAVFIRDNAGQLIPMHYVIDPPLALPHPGLYAMFFQRDYCDAGTTYILVNTNNAYPYGNYWLAPRVTTGTCILRPVDAYNEGVDLIFEVEYCTDVTTPAQRETWGRLKTIYR